MKTLLPFQNLSRAAELMDDFARRHGLADGFDAQYFLALAVRDILLPYVVLPSQFHYYRIQRSLRIPLKHPEYVTPYPDGKGTLPRDAEFFYIDRLTAHDLIVQAGKPVELRSLCNLRADGRTEKFSAVEPFVQITVDDLRITDEQLRWYAKRLLAKHQKSSQEAADTQRVALDDAAASGKTSKPSLAAEPDESRETPEQRQKRRLARFRELGGIVELAGGGQWRLTGRGVLARLSREEEAAGRQRHDASDVSKELKKAAEAEYREQIGS